MDNLQRVDWNLLVTLEVLLTERSVTRAAKRLHLSQPSVSVQLRKLRELFRDPLLQTSPGGMTPTTRARELAPRVRDALDVMGRLLEPSRTFDPQASITTWQIAAADYGEYAVVLPFLKRLRGVAPGMRLAIKGSGGDHARMLKQLQDGSIDLALMARDPIGTDAPRAVLYNERYVLVARKNHPGLVGKLTVDRLTKLAYILMSPEGGFSGVTDGALEALGRKRRVVVSTQHFLAIPEMVAQTDLVALLPSRLVARRNSGIQVREPPIRIPSYDMMMVWHARSEHDPAHRWLREQIRLATPA